MKKTVCILLCLCLLSGLILANAAEQMEVPKMKENCVYYVITPELIVNIGGWNYNAKNAAESYRKYIIYDGGRDSSTDPAQFFVEIPQNGTYNIFLHTRDYAENKPKSRYFNFNVDGEKVGEGGKHGTEGWAWECFENISLTAGQHKLSFEDLAKYARFDLILITDDLEYVPGNTKEELLALETNHLYDGPTNEVVTEDPNAGRPDTEIAVRLNDKWLEFDVPPMLINDRTMVPMRAIFEALGATVTWDDLTQTATGNLNGKAVSVTVNNPEAVIDGNTFGLDQPPVLQENRTLVPLRFIAEAYNTKVTWDDENKIVNMRTKTEFYSEELDEKKIIFIGDSFVFYGQAVLNQDTLYQNERRTNDQGYFAQLCKENGMDVKVTNWTFGNHSIKYLLSNVPCAANRGCDGVNHLDYLTDRNYDYVVISGNRAIEEDAMDIFENAMNVFKAENPNTKFIFLCTYGAHLNNNLNILHNLEKIEALGYKVVDWGGLVMDIQNNKTEVPGATLPFTKNSFIVAQSEVDGYHPNPLSGYITSLMTYCAITGKSAYGQPYAFCNDKTKHLMYDFDSFIGQYYGYNGSTTNLREIFASPADISGIQQLIDRYLAEESWRTYNN